MGVKVFGCRQTICLFSPTEIAYDRGGVELHFFFLKQPLTCAFRYRARGVGHISSAKIHYKNKKSWGVETRVTGVETKARGV